MVSKDEYQMAYVEVLEVLKYLPEVDISKLPASLIKEMTKNKSKQYNFTLDRTKNLNLQISGVSRAILTNMYRKYWATDYERKIINIMENKNRQELEDLKSKKYSVQSLFQKK